MRLRYTPQAIHDINEIKAYISTSLRNETAAKRIASVILQGCTKLKTFPFLGFSVRDRYGIDSEDRILLCENYIAVYTVEENIISVSRIIDGRQDYIRILQSSLK